MDLEQFHRVSRAVVVRLVETGDVTRAELITFLSVRSDQIPLLECLIRHLAGT